MRLTVMTRGTRCSSSVLLVVLAGLCAPAFGCASEAGGRQAAPSTLTSTAASGSIIGTIGNQPFQGRAAYLIPSASWSDGVSRTSVLIVQRPVTCQAILGTLHAEPLVLPGEYMVKVELYAGWPVHPGSVWLSTLGRQTKNDPNAAEITFVTQGGNGAHSGTFIAGQVQVLESTPNGGVLSIRAANDPNDPFIRSIRDEGSRQRLVAIGTVSGSIPFTVCAR
jgi:hypothetical protein